jgi:DNA-nicking Smr family endonuclease
VGSWPGYNLAVKKRPANSADDPSEDAEAFARAVAGVTPVPPERRQRVPLGARISPVSPLAGAHRRTIESVVPSDADTNFAANGVDRREIRKLTRGDYSPGDRLDLHRMTAAAAVTAVTRFIERSRASHRCVCIVHGRGLHSEGNVAVLKSRVRDLLRQSKAVLAYADAPARDGGAGAVYVLLRK